MIVNFIRQCTEDSKLKENTSMELYQKIQSPVTTELEKLGKKIEDVFLMHVLPPLEEPYYYQEAIDERKIKTHMLDVFQDVDKYNDVIYTFRTANLERSYPFTIEPIRVGFCEINRYQ